MQCVEDKEVAKYKCPKCESPYCSVKCFKLHKEKCNDIEHSVNKPAESENTPDSVTDIDASFKEILENDKVQELLGYSGVKSHLKLIYELLTDPQLSGEYNEEGRRMVALKKLRELRKGGREANEAIEDLVVTVTNLDSKN